MTRLHVFLAATAIFLAGCYNLVVINAGVANKSAAAIAAPFDIDAYCAALANSGITFKESNTKIEQKTRELCEVIAAEKQKGKK